ncbi:MAG: type VI secretion system baseplate subunit TssE [Rhodospirillales bacterium]|nr:type VI secretion system baseplate subunit TssE [Rhodospirillales bacterium]MDH3792838.1 type VI secretion system baseplate subunit TssE [Rhodospirillales bacterium]MDH3917868.1 type VI secretion system baseplate subunit TssE [Rhodospirillales bacterium]MDH3965962.1 type VI secretion system baseplate subunit TssE [Rhodospirillales bacterium]
MAELTPKERLQPSLLDRLTDNEPDQQQEAREKRVLSMRKLRESVQRDLAWLLNSSNLETVQDLDEYPLVSHSVINYGLPDLAGKAASGIDLAGVERMLRQAIWDFEPRILRNTVKVRSVVASDQMNRNAVAFEIEGDLWAQPVPLHLFLRTEIDLDSGSFSVSDSTASGTG